MTSSTIKLNKSTDDLIIYVGTEDENEIKKKLLVKNYRILVLEPSEMLYNVFIKEKQLMDFFSQNNITYAKVNFTNNIIDSFDLRQKLQSEILIEKLIGAKIIVPDFYEKNYYEQSVQTLKEIKSFMSSCIADLKTTIAKDIEWALSFSYNLKYFFTHNYFTQFKDCVKNKPVIVVSAGPSLDKNIDLLKKVQGHITIICVYTAYCVLLKHHINPDFVITLESKQILGDDIFLSDEFVSTKLLYSSNVQDKTIESKFKEKILITGFNDVFLKNLFDAVGIDFSFIAAGGSVSCLATSFANFIGANKIIFLGLDLAYEKTKTHAKGTIYDNDISPKEKILNMDTFAIKGSINEFVETNKMFFSFLNWFENYIQKTNYNRTDKIDFIDATEGGAFIKGTKIQNFEETVLLLEKDFSDINKIFNKCCENKFFDNLEIQNKINSYIEKTILALEKIYSAAKNGEKLCLKLYNMYFDLATNKTDANIIIFEKEKAFFILNELDIVDDIIYSNIEAVNFIKTTIVKIQYKIQADDMSNEPSSDCVIMKRNYMLYSEISFVLNKVVSVLK